MRSFNFISTLLLFGIYASINPQTAQAFHTASQGVSSTIEAANALVANPPLPMLRYEDGNRQFSIQPAYMFGEAKSDDSPGGQGFDTGGSFRGIGGGVSFSYAFAERWGTYFWGIGSRNTGAFNFTQVSNCGGGGCTDVQVTNANASIMIFSTGLVYQWKGDTQGDFALPIFFGPILANLSSEQTVRNYQAGVIQDDFDMEVSQWYPGFMIGAQAAITFKDNFEFNPFLLAAAYFGDSCQVFDVTRQGVDNGLSAESTPDCGGSTSGGAGSTSRQIDLLDNFGFAGGINLTYKPWNLSVNLTAPFIRRFLISDDFNLTMLTFTKKFGN